MASVIRSKEEHVLKSKIKTVVLDVFLFILHNQVLTFSFKNRKKRLKNRKKPINIFLFLICSVIRPSTQVTPP